MAVEQALGFVAVLGSASADYERNGGVTNCPGALFEIVAALAKEVEDATA